MAEGIVKWFDDAKGYGFITPVGDQFTLVGANGLIT